MLKYFTVFSRKKKNPLACTLITAVIVTVGLGWHKAHQRTNSRACKKGFNPVPLKPREAQALILIGAGSAPWERLWLSIRCLIPHSSTAPRAKEGVTSTPAHPKHALVHGSPPCLSPLIPFGLGPSFGLYVTLFCFFITIYTSKINLLLTPFIFVVMHKFLYYTAQIKHISFKT